MKKVNVMELTEKLNKFRMAHPNKSFTREELQEELQKLGFNSQARGAIIPKFFTYEKIGQNRIYMAPKDPIHKLAIEGIYQIFRNSKNKSRQSKKIESDNSEEAALALLSARGYQIRKCIGFDLERFQKEQPVLYRKYLKYETV